MKMAVRMAVNQATRQCMSAGADDKAGSGGGGRQSDERNAGHAPTLRPGAQVYARLPEAASDEAGGKFRKAFAPTRISEIFCVMSYDIA